MERAGWRSAVGRFGVCALCTLVPVVALGVVLGDHYRHEVDREALHDAEVLARTVADSAVRSQLVGRDIRAGLTDLEVDGLRRTTSSVLESGTALRLRLRTVEGRVMFDAERPGDPPGRDVVDDEVVEAASGEPVIVRTTLGADPIDGGRSSGAEAVEVYLAVESLAMPGEPIAVLEVYVPYEPIAASRDASLANLRRTLFAGLVVLWVALAAIVWSVTRRVHRQSAANRHLALHDGLTGLPNRLLFTDRVDHEIAQARRSGADVVVAVVDLDGFQAVNDTLGHDRGDEFLGRVAERVQAALRPGDTLARLGGDEFGLVLAAPVGTVIDDVLARVQAAVSEEIELDGIPVVAECSVGYAVWPHDAQDGAEVRRAADLALVAAKQARGEIARFAPDLDHFDPARLGLVSELRRAIAADELIVHFQPKVDVLTRAIVSFEALVRWQHPERGLVPPNEFLPVAESTGLIGPLTRRVVDLALRQFASWGDVAASCSLAINISARNLRDHTLPEYVLDRLAAHGIPPERLVLEITETSFTSDPVRAGQLLDRLDRAGIHLSLDDFGQGYTSLSFLGRLPVRELKIDRAFVAQMTVNADDRAIVASVIDLGHRLGMKVVAEGVETEDVLDALAALGCDVAQGYLFARPLPPDDAVALLRAAATA